MVSVPAEMSLNGICVIPAENRSSFFSELKQKIERLCCEAIMDHIRSYFLSFAVQSELATVSFTSLD